MDDVPPYTTRGWFTPSDGGGDGGWNNRRVIKTRAWGCEWMGNGRVVCVPPCRHRPCATATHRGGAAEQQGWERLRRSPRSASVGSTAAAAAVHPSEAARSEPAPTAAGERGAVPTQLRVVSPRRVCASQPVVVVG